MNIHLTLTTYIIIYLIGCLFTASIILYNNRGTTTNYT